MRGQGHPLLAAQLHLRPALHNRQYLVGGAVVVVEGVDAVAPGATPAVAPEGFLGDGRGVRASQRQSLLVDQQGQGGMVGNQAVIGQQVRGAGGEFLAHRLSPLGGSQRGGMLVRVEQVAWQPDWL